MKKLNNKCSNQDISSCMMLKLVTYFNRMLKKSQIDLGDVEITKTSTETTTVESSRSLNDVEKMSDDEQMSQVITDKLYNFIRTRSMKWHVSNHKLYRYFIRLEYNRDTSFWIRNILSLENQIQFQLRCICLLAN